MLVLVNKKYRPKCSNNISIVVFELTLLFPCTGDVLSNGKREDGSEWEVGKKLDKAYSGG